MVNVHDVDILEGGVEGEEGGQALICGASPFQNVHVVRSQFKSLMFMSNWECQSRCSLHVMALKLTVRLNRFACVSCQQLSCEVAAQT